MFTSFWFSFWMKIPFLICSSLADSIGDKNVYFYFSPSCPNEMISLPINIACVGSLKWPRGCVTLKTAADIQTLVLLSVGVMWECHPDLKFRPMNIQRMVLCPSSRNYYTATQAWTSSMSSCRWHFVVSVTYLGPSPSGCCSGDPPQCLVYLKALKKYVQKFHFKIYVTRMYTFLVDGWRQESFKRWGH